jgi:hypothetical protein
MSKSFGITLGRGIGKLGALAVEGAVRGAYASGQFAQDVAEGAQQGYAERHAQLLITREQKRVEAQKAREALKLQHSAAMTATTMVVAVEPPKPHRGKVALS